MKVGDLLTVPAHRVPKSKVCQDGTEKQQILSTSPVNFWQIFQFQFADIKASSVTTWITWAHHKVINTEGSLGWEKGWALLEEETSKTKPVVF